MLIDNRDKQEKRIDFMVWQFTTLVISHYIYMQSRKWNKFVLNKLVEKIVKDDNLCAKKILVEDIEDFKEVDEV